MHLAPGVQVGPYTIESAIGAGGMGRVFRAFDSRLERAVALKVLAAPPGDETRARLLAEARSASALNHPHICTVYDVGEHEGGAYIAMELVEGTSIHARLAGGPFAVGDTLRYGCQVADALAHAHERGIIHRDLKTANVMLAPGGRAKVVDFGLAQRVEAASLTETVAEGEAIVAGTVASMAPEQLRGEALDARCDVWALGVLLHEMLTGRGPFEGRSTFDLADAILRGEPAPLPEEVPPRLRQVVRRCLARDRDQRFRQAGEVRVALDALLDLAEPAATVIRLERPSRVESAAPASDAGDGADFRLGAPPGLSGRVDRTGFVGREGDWARLDQCWQAAGSGQRQVVLLSGEPGIGKTRLALEWARSTAAAGGAVLVGRCDEDALVPYQPFVEAIGQYVALVPDHVLAHDVAGGASHLDLLSPEIGRRLRIDATPSQANVDGQRYRLFESVVALLGAITARQPLVLLVDDLHWADQPTLSLLRHIVRSPQPLRLCLVGTYRDTELARTHPLSGVLADLRREAAVTRIALHGLDAGAVVQMMKGWTTVAPAAPFVARVHDETAGNPFFLVEVLEHLRETDQLARVAELRTASQDLGIPQGVKETIGRRLAHVSQATGRVLSMAAVVGRSFSLPVLAAALDMPEADLLDGLDEAQSAMLIGDVPGAPGRYTFTHALIRDVLYDELSSARRARAHWRVAEAFERTAPRDQPPLADLAHHYSLGAAAGDVEKAVDYATRAGEHAARQLAYEEAARFFEMAMHALELRPDASTRGRLADLSANRGRAFAAVGQWPQAREALEYALAHLDPSAVERRAELSFQLAHAAFWVFDMTAVRRLAEEATALGAQVGRRDLQAGGLAWLGAVHTSDGDLPGAISLFRQALAEGGERTMALGHAALTLYLAGRPAEGIAVGRQAAVAARDERDTAYVMFAESSLAVSLVATGQYRDGARVFAEVGDYGRKYGVTTLRARAIAMSAGYHLDLYAYDRAEARQQEAREMARGADFLPPVISAGVDLLLTYARTGELARADRIRDEVAETIRTVGGWHGWLWRLRFSQALAEIALARGQWDQAIEHATAGITESAARHRPKYQALGLTTRAQAAQALGRTRDALVDLDDARTLAAAIGDPALELRTLAARLAIDGTDELGARAAALVARISAELPDEDFVRRFHDAEPVRLVRKLTA